MKKHFLSFIILALTLGWSSHAWATTTIYMYHPTASKVEIEYNYGNNNWQGYVEAIKVANCTGWWAHTTVGDLCNALHFRTNGSNSWNTSGYSQYVTNGTNNYIDLEQQTKVDASAYTCGGGDEPTIPDVLKLDGNWPGHSWDNCQALNKNVNVFTTTITVTSIDQFECCFKDNNCSDAALVKPNTQWVTSTGTNCTVGTSGNPNNNFTVTPSHTGNISITVTYGDNGAISVNFAQETAPTPTDPCPNCKKITK